MIEGKTVAAGNEPLLRYPPDRRGRLTYSRIRPPAVSVRRYLLCGTVSPAVPLDAERSIRIKLNLAVLNARYDPL